jgi:hypothetical protein
MPKAPYVPKPKPVNVFVVAEQFRLASKLATLAPLLPDKYADFEFVRGLRMSLAEMACSAFALELYLKCLIRMEKKAYQLNHNLERLYNILGIRNRRKIRRHFYENDTQVRSYVEREYADQAKPIDDLFDFCLSASSKAFVQMRYAFEGGIPQHKGWLGDAIIECARKVILEKHPDWEEYQQLAFVPETSFRPTSPTR